MYSAYVTTFDINNVESPPSNTIVFYCFTTPSWGFKNLMQKQIIRNSYYDVELSYSQLEGELLNSWKVIVYDSKKQEIMNSGVQYQTEVLSYKIPHLEDNNSYYVLATCTTINGLAVETDYYEISVEYINPSMFAMVGLENQKDQGNIKIQSRIISILGTSNPDPPIYIDDKMVDLTEDGSWVRFKDGFLIPDNFTLQVNIKKFKINKPIIIPTNGLNNIEIYPRVGDYDGVKYRFYIELKAYNAITNYIIFSNLIPEYKPYDLLYIWIRKINNVYELKIKNLSAKNTYGDLKRFTYGELKKFTYKQLRNGDLG